MHTTRAQLFKKFDEALTWNGLLFICSKVSKTFISFFLFSHLSAEQFSVWAVSYSSIFLLLLWSDFGFSRSVPQFLIYASHDSKLRNSFLRKIIFFKILLLFFISIILFFSIFKIAAFFKFLTFEIFFYLAIIIFFLEGLSSLLKLVFHTYFHNKLFNSIESIALISQAALCIYGGSVIHLTGSNLLLIIYGAHIGALLFILLVGSCVLPKVLHKGLSRSFVEPHYANESDLLRGFVTHSSALWSLLVIQSITERNFLIPFFTLILGPQTANIFKVANDGALLFERFVLKTIGTNALSLLTHLEFSSKTYYGLELITKRIILYIIPLGILIGGTFIALSTPPPYQGEIARIFFVLTILYLTQAAFIGYDHVLEVQKRYKELFISAMPYSGIILLYAIISTIPSKPPLLVILCIIHALRMVGLFIRVVYVQGNKKGDLGIASIE